MYKRFLLAAILVLAMALPASAEVTGLYGGVKVIDSIQSKWGSGDVIGSHTQNTFGGGIFVGYDFYPQSQIPLRAELEYAIRSDAEKSETMRWGSGYIDSKATWGLQTLFANFYFDIHNSTAFTPYLGAGLGMGFVRSDYEQSGNVGFGYESYSRSNRDTVFAWNVGAGCAYSFTDNIAADLAYRYVGLGESDTKFYGQSVNTNGSANEFSLGLRFSF